LEDLAKTKALASAAQNAGRTIEVYIKPEVSPLTPASSGCTWQDAADIGEFLQSPACSHLRWQGFMGIAPLGVEPSMTLALFRNFMEQGSQLWKKLGANDRPAAFSLGMSSDAPLAIQAAHEMGLSPPVIRLGSAVFGPRL
jgi:uncharacterized pyridoxal phosphate-containing UPF0001 family protein